METTLYSKSSTGNLLIWNIKTKGDSYIVTHGRLNGKLQTKTTKAKPKNIGKSNATTAEEQAVVEAKAKVVAQRKKGYYDTKEEALSHVEFTPMTLANWKDHNSKITYPCYVQIKLNGLRFMVDKSGKGLSKSGEPINLPEHIQVEVDTLRYHLGISFKGLDGEIYSGNHNYGGLSLQRIVSAFRKPNEETPMLQYWIYNIPDANNIFSSRVQAMRGIDALIRQLGLNHVKVLPTTFVSGVKYVDGIFEKAVENKEEGIVIHNAKGVYEFGKRSYNSQKRKPREDAEAKVISSTIDKNGQGVLTCVAVNGLQKGQQFDCLMRKDSDKQINYRLYENSLLLIGKHIQYEYEELTDVLKPSKPVGVGLRDVSESGNPIL